MNFDKVTNLDCLQRPRYSGSFIFFFAMFAFLAWQVTHPVLTSLIWAAMLSFIVAPIYKKILVAFRGRFCGLAAGITLCLVGTLFVLPLVFVFATLGAELSSIVIKIYNFIARLEISQANIPTELMPAWTPQWIADGVVSFLGDSASVRAFVQNVAKWLGGFFTDVSGRLIHGASSMLFNTMLTLMVSFFFIRDGARMVEYLKSVTPLEETERENFFRRTRGVLQSVIYGVLLTVTIQACLGGLGWWFVGLDNPAFFGMLMFFFGLFPAGTTVVWLPGALYLFLTGDVKNGAILLLWGAAVVGTVDNLLRPFLISGGKDGEEIPTLAIILGLFGGVIAWGFVGIFLGPLVLVLFMIVFEIYRTRRFDTKES